MTPMEFSEIRKSFGMGRKEFGDLLGYTGHGRNIWITIKRYETGERDIPPMVERVVLLLSWFKSDFGYLPDLGRGERAPLELPAEFVE